jgi:hypothetical protein
VAADLTVAQVQAVTDALNDKAAKDPNIQAALNALLLQMAKQDCDTDAKKKVDCRIASIKSFLGGWTIASGSLSVQQQDDLWAAFDPIASTVPASTDPKDTLIVMARFGKLTGEMMNSVKALKPDQLYKDDAAKLAALFTAADKSFQGALTIKNVGTAIHVTGAWYGDLGQIDRSYRESPLDPMRDGLRFCAATAGVAAFCEGQQQCYEPPPATASAVPANGTSTDINGTKLCGYEPAPYADPKTVGLIAHYECVAVQDVPRSQAPRTDRWIVLRTGAWGTMTCAGNAP